MVVPKEDVVEISGFGGINLASDAEYIADNELAYCNNFLLGPRGELIKRDGYGNFPNFQGTRVLGNFIDTTGLPYLFTTDGTHVWWSTNAKDAGTYTEVTTLTGKTIHYATQLNNAYYISASDGVYKWTSGSTATLLAGSPANLQQLISFQTQLFGFYGSTLYYTSISNPDIWTSPGGLANISPGDGDNITAITQIQDRILIFKSNSMWILYLADATELYQVRGLDPSIGATWRDAVANVRGLIYFLSESNFWVTDGVVVNRIGDAISPTWIGGNRVYSNNTLDFVAPYSDDFIILNVTSIGCYAYRFTNPRGFTQIDIPGGGYSGNLKKVQIKIGAGSVVVEWARGNQYLHPGMTYGTAFTCNFQTKTFAFDNTTRMKRDKYAFCLLGRNPWRSDSITNPGLGTVRPTYSYLIDDVQTPTYDFPVKSSVYPENMKLRGAGYFRSFNFNFGEISTITFSVISVSFINHLKRQQIEAAT